MTVLETLSPTFDPSCLRDPRRLFNRAALCNRLAKGAHGFTRTLLYEIKSECIDVLQTRFPDALDVRGDFDRHRGLLSISLKEGTRRRLHFHEAWIPAA